MTVALATSGTKTPLRVRLGRGLERLGARLRGSSNTKAVQPEKRQSESERLLGASHDGARLVTNPEGIPELARAMGRMRAYHDLLRVASSRSPLATDSILRFENVERLTSGDSVVGYRLLMVNHNGLHAVATTVFVKTDGSIAGAYGKVPGKVIGKGGVFDYDSRQGYDRAAVERLAE